MEINQGKPKLLELVRGAYEGKVMLPDFQRNFVWDRFSIEEFIESLLDSIFIGTLLILETIPGKEPFKTIFIQGAEKVNPKIEANPNIIILDGQQRLTSLFYAIYSPDIPLKYTERPYVFFIDLQKLAEDNIDEALFSYPKDSWHSRSFLNGDNSFNLEKLKESKIIPLKMFDDQGKFYSLWYKHFEPLFSQDKAEKIINYLKNMLDYRAITLSLPEAFNDQPDKIVVLFERLNRTGVKLSTYDLLVARMYKFIKLREEWEKLFNESNNYDNIKKLASFRVDSTDVPFSFIRALTLSKEKSIKDRDLIKIDERVLNKAEWNRVVGVAERKVLNRLFDINNYGIGEGIDKDIEKWFPYSTIVIPLLAFYLKYNHPDVKKVDIWYWSVVFSESYSGSTESKIMKDFREVSRWFDDNLLLPEVVKDLRVQIKTGAYSLKDVKRAGSSLYKGVFNLIFRNNPIDFYEPEDIENNVLNDHHIFPKNFLKSKSVNVDQDIVLNRTLIFDRTNKIISNKSPADYVREMIEIQKSKNLSFDEAENVVKETFEKHFIDNEMYEIMKNTSREINKEKIKENFEKFVEKREALILEKIKQLIGIK
jgi:hypothetical protein